MELGSEKGWVRHFCSCSSNNNVRVYTRKHKRLYQSFVRTVRPGLYVIWEKEEKKTGDQNIGN